MALTFVVLAGLYPTHDAYVAAMRAATEQAVARGFMLGADAREWMVRVEASLVGRSASEGS
jgi:hypothetical protein